MNKTLIVVIILLCSCSSQPKQHFTLPCGFGVSAKYKECRDRVDSISFPVFVETMEDSVGKDWCRTHNPSDCIQWILRSTIQCQKYERNVFDKYNYDDCKRNKP